LRQLGKYRIAEVIGASALATVYVGLLDQLWAIVTKKVYGG